MAQFNAQQTRSNLTLQRAKDFWLDKIVIQEGPPDILAPFFLAAHAAVSGMGVRLALATPEELLSANMGNRDSWGQLVPMFDYRWNALTKDNFCALLGYDEFGTIVSANAVRLYDWADTNFVDEAQSLHLMYAAPHAMRRPNEECSVSAREARTVTGPVAFSGAAWVRRDYRHRGLGGILPVLIKALAVSQWRLDYVFGMMAEAVFKRGFSKRFGFEHEAFAAEWKNSAHGDLTLAVLWASPEFVLDGLAVYLSDQLSRGASEIDAVILDRAAQ